MTMDKKRKKLAEALAQLTQAERVALMEYLYLFRSLTPEKQKIYLQKYRSLNMEEQRAYLKSLSIKES